ncbi:AAA family ATPase [Romboutsia ilealis]|uniref:AAA family ATPase n=1 Tax=Romboutsia faecis TaxID=2764597 RepID=A0ABR7JMM6_9FIRM|nr:AAA family ATPase [Romboutsia faecis]MRN23368.1 AAA family ATPase [Romboutsia ilealis]
MPISKLVRILLPEIQVLDHIKENGVINKEHFKKNKKVLNNTITNTKRDIGKKINSNINSTERSVQNISIKSNDINSDKLITNNYAKANNNVQKQALDQAFDRVESTLSDYVLGQKEYLPKLTIAFKRPFVYGKKDGISNTIFITGPKGSGKHLSVKAITRFLKEQKLIKGNGVYQIDLSKYKLEKDAENLFLTDIYNALYGSESVVVFDNFDKCHQSALDLLSKLVIDEKLKLNRRYREQLGQMVDVTGQGSLTLNTTDEILANGKYLVFITEKSEESIRNTFSNDFMKKVYDIISTVELTKESLTIICKFILNDYKTKINDNLNLDINFDNEVLECVLKNYDKNIGAHGLSEYVEKNIYYPLVELELTGKINNEHTYELKEENDTVVLVNEVYNIELSSVLKAVESDNLDELNKELDNIIGLSIVKEFIKKLEDNIRVQSIRRNKGSKEAKLSLHMIFTGNPGTGKTTMARIMAKYLKALGYLSSGHLVEVSRNDLVGQYVGETAQKTMNKVNSAMGGILFIDEAYAIARDENDIFGIEAVDTIVKAVEDNRDNLVVILAGYTKEMEDFLKTNSGLKSRFNYNVEFEDYTSNELLEISKVIAKSNGYLIDENIDDNLLELFEGKQIKGKNDSGNGRLARNIIEKAIANQSNRLAKLDEKDLNKDEINKLTIRDFGLDKKEVFSLEKELSKVVGLDEVKEFVRDLEKQLIAKEKRKQVGVSVKSSQSLNMIFTGNPGTGKTTVARLIGNLMKNMGILKSGQVIETDRTSLVGQYAGETTKKVTEIFQSALGGVLFIDEAYALMSSENDPLGKEAVDTLVKLIEDFREDIVVIMAGYDKEMKEFLNTNSGLRSRFPLSINFKDYDINELVEIGKTMIKSKGFILAGNSEDELEDAIKKEKQKSGAQSGNGRMVRNIIEKAIREQSSRIADMDTIDENSAVLLIEEDFGIYVKSQENFNLDEKLNEVVGLNEVKEFIKSLQAQLKIKEQRKSLGLPVDESQTLHMIFKGNPGTGKTTMARIIGEVLYNIGVLNSNTFVETDRSGLVAGYVGQTAIKTKEKLESALGGILFIDEAYALAQDAGSQNGFGKEAIDTLVKGMDDNRDNLVVILAGYSEDMDRFLEANPGLKSRFANIIEFKDYSADDLLTIADNLFKSKGYEITKEAKLKMRDIFKEACKVPDFGNGRYVRNILEKSVRNQAVRLEKIDNMTKEHLITIEECDVSKVNL